jgi:hypothetical protein
MRRWVDEILFDPKVLIFVLKKHTTFGNGPCQRNKRPLGRELIFALFRKSMRPQKK